MARLIFADTHTFHSKIKKAAIQIILAHYKLFPPPMIKIRVEEILEGGAYLWGEVDMQVLLLIAAIIHKVLCIYKTRRFIPKESKLNSEALDGAFKMMAPKLEAVISHAYHGPKLNAMLKEWVNLGMTGYTPRYTVQQQPNSVTQFNDSPMVWYTQSGAHCTVRDGLVQT
ncbi:hypothetical protein BKA83DRAFT_4121279 [Pisolithus microcarpus]|nr:hypothetical protein BKA83DRAFT_4121279 [Pisolithus microcarpus]